MVGQTFLPARRPPSAPRGSSARRANLQSLSIEITGRTGLTYAPYVKRNLIRAHAILRPALREFSLALVGDRRMAELHREFMDLPGSTDVLTFELDHDPRGRVTAGEVVVCVPYAIREARRRRVPAKNELLLYALHGMLHLCGYDDRTDRDFATMHRREDEILNQLGVGPVFAPTPARSGSRRPRPRAKARAAGAPKAPSSSTTKDQRQSRRVPRRSGATA
jgi:probable rRNA maturation factor